MAIPGVPLPSPIAVGYTPHNDLHTDANDALNYLSDAATLAALVLASPAGAPGAPDYITLGNAHIAAALKDLAAGAVGTPPIAFNGDTDTGIYQVSADNLGLAAGGALVVTVQKSGANSRNFFIGDGTNSANIFINGAAATGRNLTWQSAGSARWEIRANNAAESGSDVGSDFVILSKTDAGAALNNNAITVKRSTGHVGINTPATVTPARLNVVGTVDEVQMIVRANATQTSDIEEWQTSGGAVLVKINGAGLFFPAQFTTAGTPAWAAGLVGAVIFDTTLNKLRVAGAAAWETVTSV